MDEVFTPFSTATGDKYLSEYDISRGKFISEMLPQSAGALALDVGCGGGYFTSLLQGRGWHVTCIDTHPDNLAQAAPHAVRTICADALDALKDFPSNRFEYALALEIIEHMPQSRAEQVLDELYRVIRPEGRVLLSTPNRHSLEGLGGYFWGEKLRGKKWYAWDKTHVKIYSAIEMAGLLKRAGFRIESVAGYHYEGWVPGIGNLKLPWKTIRRGPLGYLGFNVAIEVRKRL